jgi:hypothetical protein
MLQLRNSQQVTEAVVILNRTVTIHSIKTMVHNDGGPTKHTLIINYQQIHMAIKLNMIPSLKKTISTETIQSRTTHKPLVLSTESQIINLSQACKGDFTNQHKQTSTDFSKIIIMPLIIKLPRDSEWSEVLGIILKPIQSIEQD